MYTHTHINWERDIQRVGESESERLTFTGLDCRVHLCLKFKEQSQEMNNKHGDIEEKLHYIKYTSNVCEYEYVCTAVRVYVRCVFVH